MPVRPTGYVPRNRRLGASSLVTGKSTGDPTEDLLGLLGGIIGNNQDDTSLTGILPTAIDETPQRSDQVIQEAARSAMVKARNRKGRGATILNTEAGLEGTPKTALRPQLRAATALGAMG